MLGSTLIALAVLCELTEVVNGSAQLAEDIWPKFWDERVFRPYLPRRPLNLRTDLAVTTGEVHKAFDLVEPLVRREDVVPNRLLSKPAHPRDDPDVGAILVAGLGQKSSSAVKGQRSSLRTVWRRVRQALPSNLLRPKVHAAFDEHGGLPSVGIESPEAVSLAATARFAKLLGEPNNLLELGLQDSWCPAHIAEQVRCSILQGLEQRAEMSETQLEALSLDLQLNEHAWTKEEASEVAARLLQIRGLQSLSLKFFQFEHQMDRQQGGSYALREMLHMLNYPENFGRPHLTQSLRHFSLSIGRFSVEKGEEAELHPEQDFMELNLFLFQRTFRTKFPRLETLRLELGLHLTEMASQSGVFISMIRNVVYRIKDLLANLHNLMSDNVFRNREAIRVRGVPPAEATSLRQIQLLTRLPIGARVDDSPRVFDDKCIAQIVQDVIARHHTKWHGNERREKILRIIEQEINHDHVQVNLDADGGIASLVQEWERRHSQQTLRICFGVGQSEVGILQSGVNQGARDAGITNPEGFFDKNFKQLDETGQGIPADPSVVYFCWELHM